ncbi:hypothetical protein [Acidithrix ferrooxidans]|uniref:Uncharacterized protein n=1 Tax=Acidithrix ferrooxidans TaxID=1280514 RepID=A0A0D8HG63_9ACTN|nr:hypothetical protein [Acidithrix ferrooxidans]KJF16955.1 hypothetical protein AXFE_21570 [Acidithrix ferrooxidans]
MEKASESTSPRLRTVDLIEIGRKIEPELTERTLEYWRNQNLLPSPVRSSQEGKRPIWTYPDETTDQLRTLLRLRKESRDPNVLRAALWFEGYPVKMTYVRKSIATYLRQLQATFEKELEKRRPQVADESEASWFAIEQVASKLARKRRKGLPRLARQPQADRIQAVALMLGLLFGNPSAMQHLEHDAPSVERLIGLDQGRRARPAGIGPWLDRSPEEGLEVFARVGNLSRLIEVIDIASDEELQLAATFSRNLLDGMTAFSKIADAFVGVDNTSGLAGIEPLQGNAYTAVVILPLFVSILRSAALVENLKQIVHSYQTNIIPLEQQAKELAALSEDDRIQRLKNLSELPFAEQLRIKRLIVKYSETP